MQRFTCQDKVERILDHVEPAESTQAILEIHNTTIPPHGKTLVQSVQSIETMTDRCVAMWYGDHYGTGKQGKISKWREASDLGLEGLGWRQERNSSDRLPYSRFPPRAEAMLNCTDCLYTWNLSACSAGVLVRFATDADEIMLKVERHSLGDGKNRTASVSD
jgi:hypothetical protein